MASLLALPVSTNLNCFFSSGPSPFPQLGGDIEGESLGDAFGEAVAISADGLTIVVGAVGHNGSGPASGHTRIYRLTDVSGFGFNFQWQQLGADIDGESPQDISGGSVAISDDGNTVLIGATLNNGNGTNSGHARAFSFNSDSGQWVQLGADIDGEFPGDQSGCSVSLSADGFTAAIGARNNGGNGAFSGQVRIFSYLQGSDQWVQLGNSLFGEAAGDQSGFSISLNAGGNIVAIGAPLKDIMGQDRGNTRVFLYDDALGLWVQLAGTIDGEGVADQSGWSVSLDDSGYTLAIGSRQGGASSPNPGHVRIFLLPQHAKLSSRRERLFCHRCDVF